MKHESPEVTESTLTHAFDSSARRVLAVDVEKYQTWLDGSGLSAEQKEEFLRAVWSVVVTFVELGFGVHPLQEVCGKESESGAPSPKQAFDRLESEKLDNPPTDKKSGP